MLTLTTNGRWAVAGAVGLLCNSTALLAQPADEDLAEVVVTGTSVKGAAPVGTSVQVIDSEVLRATGISNTNDVLRAIPQILNLGNDEGRGGGTQGAQVNITQAKTVNLRGLGTESTLVLLNGRRIAPSGTTGAGYDVSVIPGNAIGRIEVVADGASAIYGSEAVGGVINFITKRDFVGAETTLHYGFADGFDEKRFGQTFGFSWVTGNVFATFERYRRGGIFGSARDELTQDLRSVGGPDLRLTFASPGNIVVGTGAAAVRYATPRGTRGVGLLPSQFVPNTILREDVNDTRSLLVDQYQDTAFLSVRQDITDDLEVWFEGNYSNRDYDGFGTSLNRGAASATLVVPNTNPFYVNPTGGTGPVSVEYSFSGTFPARSRGGEEGANVSAGLKWQTFGDWTVDAFATRSGNSGLRRATQVWVANQAAVLADSNPATAFNPFCDTDAFSNCNNPATIAKLTGYNIIAATLRTTDVVAKASGTVYKLPGGPIAMAVGAEYTKSKLDSSQTQLTLLPVQTRRQTFAGRDIKAGFAEVLVPLFGADNARTGLHKLDLSAAVRYERFSDFGSTSNPKFGVTWEPVESLALRGSYGTSFRAPTLTNIDFGATTTYAATTLADGPGGPQIRAITLLGGRPGLKPESADTYTVGFDFKPTFAPGLTTSLTYYNIDYSDRITALSASVVLGNSVYAYLVQRNPSAADVLAIQNSIYYTSGPENPAGIVAIIDARVNNLGGLKQAGVDAKIDYQFSALGGDWHAGVTATKLLTAEQSAAVGLPFLDVLDTINNPVSFRARGNFSWSSGPLRADVFVNHTGTYQNNLRNPIEDIATYTTFDLSGSYTVPEDASDLVRGLRFALSVVNVNDKPPPLVINTLNGVEGLYDGQNASATGRFVAFELSKKW